MIYKATYALVLFMYVAPVTHVYVAITSDFSCYTSLIRSFIFAYPHISGQQYFKNCQAS